MDHSRHTLTPLSRSPASRPEDGVTFVLSGGASRGALQVGMLQSLVEHGVVPDFIVGTSVGAYNGAYLACRPTPDGMRALEDIWMGVRHDDIFSGGPVTVLLNLVKRQPSLYRGDGVRRLLERASADGGFSGRSFEDLAVPLAVVATNITRGQPVIFEKGPILPALLASSAIPAVLPPVVLDGEQYVDGGLLDNVGLRVAAGRAARRIYVLDTSWDGRAEKAATTLDAVIDRSLQVVMAFHLQCALESFASQSDVVLLRADESLAGSGSDFTNTARLIVAGREIAERALANPRQESERAIQRGRTALRPAWFRGAGQDSGARRQPLRAWIDAAASSVSTALGMYMRQIVRSDALVPPPSSLARARGSLDTAERQAS